MFLLTQWTIKTIHYGPFYCSQCEIFGAEAVEVEGGGGGAGVERGLG